MDKRANKSPGRSRGAAWTEGPELEWGVGREPRGMSRVGLDGVILTRIVIHQVLQALEGEPRGNVIPVVWQTEDSVMLHLPVSHRERIKTCREWRTGHHPRATS